ncbi:MAG TPA: glycosyltransferase, partial [Ignavibacteriaceae bacterium]|nr:glycosyltransferase [Ignavibacteriaceae bacterium]
KRVDKPFNKEKPVILFIGSAPNKNLKRLIQSLEGINCKLEIIGKVPDEEIDLLNDSKVDYNICTGLTEDEVIKKYEECDILSLVSTYEGFGMPIVEANIVGRPVITSNCYAMLEIAGDAALLVNPFNIEEIKNGILKIITDDNFRNILCEKGYKNSRRFIISNISDKYLNLYKKLL